MINLKYLRLTRNLLKPQNVFNKYCEYSNINRMHTVKRNDLLYSNLTLLIKNNYTNLKCFSQFITTFRKNNTNCYFLYGKNYSSQQYYSKKFESNVKHKENELEQIKLKYPQPKAMLHNFYDIVSSDLQTPLFKINPQYKMLPYNKREKSALQWTCTYHIKWPKEKKFQNTSHSKQEASQKAAWSALLYLQQQGKLKNGMPVLYDIADIKKMSKESHFILHLEDVDRRQLNLISNIFESKLQPLLYEEETNISSDTNNNDSLKENNFDTQSFETIKNWFAIKMIQKPLRTFMAKELTNLPIQNQRAEFEYLLNNHRVIIIKGQTGCGKSTRIPQYALEHFVCTNNHSNARVIVTEPRRIAATSLAERVAQERGEKVGNIVGYQVRLNKAFNPKTTRILYCTTGILIQQMQHDPNLTHCTHIIIDEVHEREVHTDILLNLVRNALKNNPNLKVIVMSATVDVDLFKNYFENAPVMDVPGFTYPVKEHFLEDINLNLYKTEQNWNVNCTNVVHDEIAHVITWIHDNKPEGGILCFLPGWDDIIKVKRLLFHTIPNNTSTILSLHSKLSIEEQKKLFRSLPPGIRKIVLSTNLAETSVTVDDIVYVVDCGIEKENNFNTDKKIMSLDNQQISQSNMKQRKGRAGRVQPGESFHLYPKLCYSQMLKHSIPEILRTNLTKIVLNAKACSNLSSSEFFSTLPSPPKESAVLRAVEELQELDMLDNFETITPLGRAAADFQLEPRLVKTLINSVIYKCIISILDIITLFSFESNIFENSLTEKEKIKKIKEELCENSDHIAMMILFEQWINYISNDDLNNASIYCTENKLVVPRLNMLNKLKDIHYEQLRKNLKPILPFSNDFSSNKEIIKGILLSGLNTFLLKRKWHIVKGRLKRETTFTNKENLRANITSDSVNYKKDESDSPFLIYINETNSEQRRSIIIRETSAIQPLTFLLFNNKAFSCRECSVENHVDVIDPILIKIEGTKFNILCSKEDAKIIKRCRNALKEMEKYFIYKLTYGGIEKEIISDNWNAILTVLDQLLSSK